MDKSYETLYHALEDTNWWFKARQDFIYRYITKEFNNRVIKIIDIGCGGGGMMNFLRQRGIKDVSGIDVSPEAINYCNKRGLTEVVVADAQKNIPFPSGTFDVVMASDVLEHLQDPLLALGEWKRLLKPGGHLVVFVPAFMFLWSKHDDINHHVARYTQKSLFALAEKQGLIPTQSSYWNSFLFVPYLLLIKLKQALNKNGYIAPKKNKLFNSLMIAILRVENVLIMKGFSFPFGVSFFASFKHQNHDRQ
jgi:SAM-dependent methyltransferase